MLEAALQGQLRELSARLAKVEALIVPSGRRQTNRSLALRREASDVRRDISEAQFLIGRLRQLFPITDAEATG